MNSDLFPDRLRAVIGNLSLRSFGVKCGLSEGALRKYLSGQSEPGRTALIAMAEAGGVRVEWLATGEGSMKRGDGGGLDLEEYGLVPRYNVKVDGGPGALVDGEAVVDTMAFKREWLRRLGLELQHLALVTARGDSMEPTIYAGDLLLVDLRQPAMIDGAIHVLRTDGDVMIKRLQLGLDDQVIVRSDNRIYSPLETTRDKLNVVGRVVWRGGRM